VDKSTKLSERLTVRSTSKLQKHRQIDRPGIMANLPRRQLISTEIPDVTPPMMQTVDFSVSFPRVLLRLLNWFFIGASFLVGNFWDSLRRRGTQARRATWLRRILEKSGGSIRKIGRLLAMRIDVLPWAYSVELSKTADQMDPFPVEQAIDQVEGATGKSIGETFNQFDPEPIVCATNSCVYQAYLKDGQKVAVKVRRPGFGEILMADLKALDWILGFCEVLSIIRPGFTRILRRDLRETFQEEMNFILEARNQALFRSEAMKSGKKFFNAPKVYFELCSPDVIVEEFMSGMWLWELIAAVERKDQEALARAKQLNIDPDKVAKRLLWVNFWGLDEHILFLADLHPDNVIVRKNSKLTFIDFSSIGALSQEKRQAFQQTMYYAWKRDPLEMARASMILLEPLPPIDTIKYTKSLEATYWKFMYALESKHTEWWERTSARLWVGFVRIAREHKITMNIDVLRMIRASLLFDTNAVRLNQKIDHVKEYHKFFRYRAKAARKRVEKRTRKQIQRGIDDRLYLQIEGFADTSERLFRQLQRFLSTPVMKFNSVLDKSVYALSTLLKFVGQTGIITTVSVSSYILFKWIFERVGVQIVDALSIVVTHRFYQLIILILLIVHIRTIMFRLGDKEV
jgi:predicted unusual protein kinase regulating ubiquinone biosynthesis (AarF/ABC1/UbiB family)